MIAEPDFPPDDDDLDEEGEPGEWTCLACGERSPDVWWLDACPDCETDRWPGRP